MGVHAFVSSPPTAATRVWPAAIAGLVLFLGWLAAWQWDTIVVMVTTWHRSETFAHGFIVVPITLWLIWRRRGELAAQTPAPSALALVLLGVATLGWMVGELADVITVRQYAFVTMLISGVWAILGSRVTWTIAFPLAYLYFTVPFGEFLIPGLMEKTADFAVLALRASGVPVYREGLFLQIPSGNWSVVEGCSGLRYLIASVTLGCLYAYLTYRSTPRRALFIVASVAVPIVANWLRAYIIVMIGHLSSNRLAHGVDHLIYGWVFFGFVMLLLFWVGSFWREDQPSRDETLAAAPAGRRPGEAGFAVSGGGRGASFGTAGFVAILVGSMALVAAGPLVARAIERDNVAAAVGKVEMNNAIGGWLPVPDTLAAWQHLLTPPRESASQAFASGGRKVGVLVAVYRAQNTDSKLVSSRNLLVKQKDREWSSRGASGREVPLGGVPTMVEEDLLLGPSERLVTWRWYWIDGQVTASDHRAKLLQLFSQLRGRGDGGAIVIVYAPYESGDERAARETLRAFVADAGPSLATAVARALNPGK
jgi:exosortase A